jgi:starvation-inducible DNA-binding protein
VGFLSIDPIGMNAPGDQNESSSTVISVLRALLSHTIGLRDLYKRARGCERESAPNQLRRLFDAHFQEQLRLVDVLIDRARLLGGDSIFAGDSMPSTRVPFTVRGGPDQRRMLRDLLDAHESIIYAAHPSGAGDEKEGSAWIRDFAVGQVVLTSQLQIRAIEDLFVRGSQDPSMLARIALMAD